MEIAITILTILQVCTIAVGILTAAWGVYDWFLGDNGNQAGTGIKKIIGGILFAAIMWIVFAWIISSVKDSTKGIDMSGVSTKYSLEIHTEQTSETQKLISG